MSGSAAWDVHGQCVTVQSTGCLVLLVFALRVGTHVIQEYASLDCSLNQIQ